MANPSIKLLKYAGGKDALVPHLLDYLPEQAGRYYEPMLGSGAFFLHLVSTEHRSRFSGYVIADASEEIVNLFRSIRMDAALVLSAYRDLAQEYNQHPGAPYRKDMFLGQRRIFNDLRGPYLNPAPDQAARMLFLNRSCFNGLFRSNSSGALNSPWGQFTVIPDLEAPITRWRAVLERPEVEIRGGDYQVTTQDASGGDFVYFDPPYVPATATASFTGYTSGGFGMIQQAELVATAWRLRSRGVHVLVSNSEAASPLYRSSVHATIPALTIKDISVIRYISCKGKTRGPTGEILAYGSPLDKESRAG